MKKIAAVFFAFCEGGLAFFASGLAFSADGLVISTGDAMAAEIMVPIHKVTDKGVGEKIGTITITESAHGVLFKPDLRDLPPGVHGFHIHQNPSCDAKEKDGKMTAAEAAGRHYDPEKNEKHGGPWGDGHKGDLPALYVSSGGTTTQPVMASQLVFQDLPGRALVIHAGGDNYSDYPDPAGGGGERIACGVITEAAAGAVN
jgi:Cu-Zn family superoxide dismutase